MWFVLALWSSHEASPKSSQKEKIKETIDFNEIDDKLEEEENTEHDSDHMPIFQIIQNHLASPIEWLEDKIVWFNLYYFFVKQLHLVKNKYNF